MHFEILWEEEKITTNNQKCLFCLIHNNLTQTVKTAKLNLMGVKKIKKQSMSLIIKIAAIDIVSHIKCVHELHERENYIIENIIYSNTLNGFKKSKKSPILILSGCICVDGVAPLCKIAERRKKEAQEWVWQYNLTTCFLFHQFS